MDRPARRAAIAVAFLLLACGGGPAAPPPPYTLLVSPASVTLRTQVGSIFADEASVDVTTTGGGTAVAPHPEISYAGEAGWLTVELQPQGTGWRALLRADSTALTAGHRDATVTITGQGAAGPAVVSVALEVEPAPPVLIVSATSVTFAAEQGGADPAPQVLEVTLVPGTGAAPTIAVQPAGGSTAWLTASLTEAPGGWALTLSAAAAGLAPGDHLATLVVERVGATGSPHEVAVTFTVSPPPGALAVAPDALQFSTVEGTDPAPQAVTVFAPSPAALAATTVTVVPDTAWLGATVAPAADHLDVSVQASVAGLAIGSYAASLVVTSPGLTGSPATIPVTLTVDPAIPALQVTPTSLPFDSSFNNWPPPQLVTITGIGPGVLPPVTVTTTLSASSGWLRVTPGGAGNAQTLTIQPTPSNLPPGTFTAEIVVSATGAAGSPATVSVTLYELAATGSRCPPGSTLAWQGGGGGGGGAEPADFASSFFTTYCTRCHDSAKVGLARNGATVGVDFDTLAGARRAPFSLDIAAAAGPNGDFNFMPPAVPLPTTAERTWLGEWIACRQP